MSQPLRLNKLKTSYVISSKTGVLKVSLIIELISNGHTVQLDDSLYR